MQYQIHNEESLGVGMSEYLFYLCDKKIIMYIVVSTENSDTDSIRVQLNFTRKTSTANITY